MKLLILSLSLSTVFLVTGGPPRPDNCCMEKEVGGVQYRFIQEAQTSSYECLTDCLYEAVDVPGSLFCFAEGDLEVVCEDDMRTGLPPRPTGLPPRPSGLPPRPSGLPPRPTGLPPRPSGLPPRPSGLPPRPSGLPPRPTGLPPRPSDMPPIPSGQPPRPSIEPPTGGPGPSGTEGPEGGDGNTLTIQQTWSQELNGYTRTAIYSLPTNSQPDSKYPVVIDLHGNGGQANVQRLGFLSQSCVLVAPQGYERSWNVYSEKSKAPDVDFIKELITKIGTEIPQADTADITLVGTSNGAALIYRLLIEIENPRPFKRVIPMVSSLINKQYHDNSFWKPSVTSNTDANNYDTAVDLFSSSAPGPQFIHFHGTEDGTVPYLGGGGQFLGDDVDFLSAQETDFLWAKAFGYTGEQIPDGDGESTNNSGMFKYSYLGGAVTHYKLIGAQHNAFHPDFRTDVQNLITDAITG